MARLRDMRGGRDNDPRFGWRMKGQGAWADMIRMRVHARLQRLGVARGRPVLRTDLFQPPVAPRAAKRQPATETGAAVGPGLPAQGSLF